MSGIFTFASSFNGDLSKLNVSRVTGMYSMFYSASAFSGGHVPWSVVLCTDALRRVDHLDSG